MIAYVHGKNKCFSTFESCSFFQHMQIGLEIPSNFTNTDYNEVALSTRNSGPQHCKGQPLQTATKL